MKTEFWGLYWYITVQILFRQLEIEDAVNEEEICEFLFGLSDEKVEEILHQESAAFYNEYATP